MRRPRGGAFLEFVLLLPFLVGILLLTLDVGRMVLVKSSLQDATSAAARASARVGYAGSVPSLGCVSPGSAADIAHRTFCASVAGMPTGPISSFTIVEPSSITSLGATCTTDIDSQYVRVVAVADFQPLTPGLALFRGSSGGGLQATSIAATSVARCEVAR